MNHAIDVIEKSTAGDNTVWIIAGLALIIAVLALFRRSCKTSSPEEKNTPKFFK